jgi:hypothetical protein
MAGNGKGKGKFVPEHAMRAYEGVIIYLQSFLTSAIYEGRCSATGYFTLWEEIPNTHWIGCWVGFRFGLDAVQ